MEKSFLIGLFNRYYLNGEGAEKVLINFNDENTQVNFHRNDKTVIGEVTLNVGNGIGSIGIFQTSVVQKLLGAFNPSDFLEITPNTHGDTITSLNIKNDSVNVLATTADPNIIPKAGSLKGREPEFEMVATFDAEFSDSFKRYSNLFKASADGVVLVAFDIRPDGLTVIMNYNETLNTNRIKFDMEADTLPESNFLMCFKAQVLSEIFSANSGNGRLSISSRGLCRVEFADDDYSTTYYIVKANQ